MVPKLTMVVVLQLVVHTTLNMLVQNLKVYVEVKIAVKVAMIMQGNINHLLLKI